MNSACGKRGAGNGRTEREEERRKMITDKQISRNVKRIVKAKKMPIYELAKKLHIANETLYKRMTGRVGWHVVWIYELAEVLGVPVDILLVVDDEE